MKRKKLPLRVRGVNSIAVAVVLVLTACDPARTVRQVPPGEWSATMGGPARAPFAREAVPDSPREVWRNGMERGIEDTPVVHGDLLIVGATGRAVVTASAADGERYWLRRLRGPIVGSPLRIDDRIIAAAASREGRVTAMNIERGRKRWETKLSGTVASDMVYHEGAVYVATSRGELVGLDVENGRVQTRVRTPGTIIVPPMVHEGALIIATARDTMLRIATNDARALAGVRLPGTPSAPLALAGTRLLAPLHPNLLASYDARTLALLRIDTVDAPVLAAPVVDTDGTAYLLTRDASVWRADEHGVSRIATLGGTARESLTVTRDGLLVGTLGGSLYLLRKDGSEVWRQDYGVSVRAPAAVADGAIYVGLVNGRVVKLQ